VREREPAAEVAFDAQLAAEQTAYGGMETVGVKGREKSQGRRCGYSIAFGDLPLAG